MRPSSTKSEAINVVKRLSSLTATPRSTRITGIPAAFTSRRTGSKPVSTFGARMIASTFCWTNARSALIWLSWLPWPSRNLSVIPRFSASPRTDAVSAVRHELSAPICEKPTTGPDPAALFRSQAAVATRAIRATRLARRRAEARLSASLPVPSGIWREVTTPRPRLSTTLNLVGSLPPVARKQGAFQ
jgi:hypothetical protein